MSTRTKPGRWKYLINALVLLAPAWYFYASFYPGGAEGALAEKQLGPISATPIPADADPPYQHEGMYLKDYAVQLCRGCEDKVRTAYLRVSDGPPEIPADGMGVVHGHGAMQHVHALYPEELTASHELWLVVQTWDGRIFRSAWPVPGH